MKQQNISTAKHGAPALVTSTRRMLPVDESVSEEVTRRFLSALLAYKAGDFSVRLPCDWIGIPGKIADAFNEIVVFNQRLSSETARVSRAVGKEGKLKQRLLVPGATGGWANTGEAINTL